VSPISALGLDGRVLAGLAGMTLAAAGVGFVVAAGLDDSVGRVAAIAAPRPTLSPEAQDDAPLATTTGLPPVIAPTPVPQAPAAEPGTPRQAPATTALVPASPAPAPAPSVTTARRAPTTTTPTPTQPEPGPGPGQPRQPTADDGTPTPFRPAAATTPLEQFVIPADELATDSPAALTVLQAAGDRAPAAGTTRTDIAYVVDLGKRFAEARLPGRRATVERTVRVNAWWYGRRRAPAKAVLLRDSDGIIYSYRAGQGFAFNPVGTAGMWQRLNEGFTATQLATTLLGMGVVDERGGRRVMSWEYFDVPGEPRTIRPGVSGMAQSRLAQLMASAYAESGDPGFAAAAADAMASLSVSVGDGGTRSMVAYPAGSAAAPWFVERAYPGENPWTGAALNGFMVAILELRGAERSLRQPAAPSPAGDAAAGEARVLADEGAATLDRYLPLHDSGEWSYYGLLTPGRPWRSHLANATYHCYHVSLLRGLAAYYPDLRFAATADTWSHYAVRAGVTCPDG
jgi:hypothetical protein